MVSSKLRILVLIHAYPPSMIGGHELRCKQVVTTLQERGHKILVLTSHARGEKRSKEDSVWRTLNSSFSLEPDHSPFGWLLYSWQNIKHYHEAYKHFEPDIVLQWNIKQCSLSLLHFVHATTPVPVIGFFGGGGSAILHDSWLQFYQRLRSQRKTRRTKWMIANLINRLMYPYDRPFEYQYAVFPSQFLLEKWHMFNGPIVHDYRVIWYGIDPALFPPRSPGDYQAPPRFIYLGRPERNKDPLTFLNAIELLKNKGIKVSATLVLGTGNDVEYTKRVISLAEELSPQVAILHNAPHEKIGSILREHEVFVMLSHIEGAGRAVVEAMACGLATITTPSGGPNELVSEEKTGLTTPFSDPVMLSVQMKRFLQDDQLAPRMGQLAQGIIHQEFTEHDFITKVERYLIDIAARTDTKSHKQAVTD